MNTYLEVSDCDCVGIDVAHFQFALLKCAYRHDKRCNLLHWLLGLLLRGVLMDICRIRILAHFGKFNLLCWIAARIDFGYYGLFALIFSAKATFSFKPQIAAKSYFQSTCFDLFAGVYFRQNCSLLGPYHPRLSSQLGLPCSSAIAVSKEHSFA